MHSSLMRLMRTVTCGVAMLVIAARGARAQTVPVDAVSGTGSAVQRAQLLLQHGQRDSAATLLGARVTEQPSDGRAWFFLGSIYLADARQWHRANHPGEMSSASLLLGFAGSSFEPAQELLTDSGGVFRVVVAMERATLRIEAGGWESLTDWRLPSEELPLPPVLAELGRNLLASCPRNGVYVAGNSVAEEAAVWGIRLQGERGDLVVLRPAMYGYDPRYRARMAAAIGADSATDLATSLTAAARTRPICLAPAVDSMIAPNLHWTPTRLVLATSIPAVHAPELSLFRFARTGLTGSVWTSAARDVYDLAGRRNRALCTTLFAASDILTPPPIPSCTQ